MKSQAQQGIAAILALVLQASDMSYKKPPRAVRGGEVGTRLGGTGRITCSSRLKKHF